MEVAGMKALFAVIVCAALTTRGLDRAQVEELLAKAATAQGSAYVEARDEIKALGVMTVPILLETACDEKVDWRVRLVSRMVCERLLRSADIEELRRTNWSKEPGYDLRWQQYVTGDSYKMRTVIVPKCRQLGLWHYYLEVNWKSTGELSISDERRDKRRFAEVWPYYLKDALDGQPEQAWLPRVWADRVDVAAFAYRDDVDLYKSLLGLKSPYAVPVLVRRYEAYNKREVTGQEYFPGRHAELLRGMFAPILDFADVRHAALLEAYIAEHPALAELKPKLAEVRTRRAPSPVPDPPFRLGTNLVTRPSTGP